MDTPVSELQSPMAAAAAESSPLVTDVAPQTTSVQAQAIPALFAGVLAPLNIVTGVVTAVLGWLVGPSLTTSPVAPADSPIVWAVLAWVRRTFFNETPSLHPLQISQDTTTGLVTGKLIDDVSAVTAVDADGDPLRFTVVQAPTHGTVVINPNGTYTYTPSPAFAQTGGTDSFIVKASDEAGGFHFHGLLGFLLPDWGHSAQATVTVTVNPINHAPVVLVTPLGAPDARTGAIDYRVTMSDPDPGDVPHLAITDFPDKGAITVNPDGSLTYTPSDAARLKAADPDAVPADFVDSFGVTVTDGRGGVAHLGVNATVTPAGVAVVDTIDLGALRGVAVSPDGEHIYVTDWTNHNVTVINTDNNTVEATIPLGADAVPNGITVSSDGATVYVLDLANNSMSVIDADTNTVLRTVSNLGDYVDRVAITPDGTRAYITSSNNDSVTLLNLVTGERSVVPVGDTPYGITISPDGKLAYVANAGSDSVSVIDIDTKTKIADVEVGDHPTRIAFSPDGSLAYVTNSNATTVSVIGTTNHIVVRTIDLGVDEQPHGLAVSPDGSLLYVNIRSGSVAVIEAATGTRLATLPVDVDPLEIVVSPDGGKAYVASRGGSSVSVLSLRTSIA